MKFSDGMKGQKGECDVKTRPIVCVSLSFLLGIYVAGEGTVFSRLLFLMALVVFALPPLWPPKDSRPVLRRRRSLLRLVLCLGFFLWGFLCLKNQQRTIARVEEAVNGLEEITLTGTIYKKEVKNSFYIYFLKNTYFFLESDEDSSGENSSNGDLSSGDSSGEEIRDSSQKITENIATQKKITIKQVQVYMEADEYAIGDTIAVTGSPSVFSVARNQGNFNEAAYYYGKGIYLRLWEEESCLVKNGFSLDESLYLIRLRLRKDYATLLSEEAAGVISTMVLGDKALLDSEIKELYQSCGISHVLAISGLHISLIGYTVYGFLRKIRCSYYTAGGIAGTLVFLFAKISGMELSTRRAVFMFLLLLLGNALGYLYDSISAVFLAALLTLLMNPLSLWYAGFLFSYSAVLAVVLGIKLWKKEEGRHLPEMVATSLGIQLFTLPLTLWFYYEFPLYTVLINSLLLPFMGILLGLGIVGGLAGLIYGKLGILFLYPVEVLLGCNQRVCRFFQSLPAATVITGQPPLWLMVGYYGVLILSLSLLSLYKHWPKKASLPKKKKKRLEAGVRVGTFLALGCMLLAVLFLRPEKEFYIAFLDVGQGDGIFIETEEGNCFFIDGGSSSVSSVGTYRILSFLKYHGIARVDGWFVSHADADHTSGLYELWEAGFQIDTLYLSRWMTKDEAYEELVNGAADYGTRVVALSVGDRVESGALSLTNLAPIRENSDRNAGSMVLLLEWEGFSALFTGDLDGEGEEDLVLLYPGLQVELLKVSHHGSKSSSVSAFLESVQPLVSVISCAKKNSYGHPAAETVARLLAANSEIFYTMEGGQITVTWKNGQVYVREFVP